MSNARDVQQVIHQPPQNRDLTLNHRKAGGSLRVRQVTRLQLHRGGNGCQGIPQLMAEDGEELVLQTRTFLFFRSLLARRNINRYSQASDRLPRDAAPLSGRALQRQFGFVNWPAVLPQEYNPAAESLWVRGSGRNIVQRAGP